MYTHYCIDDVRNATRTLETKTSQAKKKKDIKKTHKKNSVLPSQDVHVHCIELKINFL